MTSLDNGSAFRQWGVSFVLVSNVAHGIRFHNPKVMAMSSTKTRRALRIALNYNKNDTISISIATFSLCIETHSKGFKKTLKIEPFARR